MSGGGLTVEQLATRNPVPTFVADVLRDEAMRGHVVEHGDGRWQADAKFAAQYAQAFSHVGHIARDERRQT